MPSAPRGESSKNYGCMPVLTGLTAKNRLRVDWGGVGVVAQGQGMGGGSASGICRAVAAQVDGENTGMGACMRMKTGNSSNDLNEREIGRAHV